jgi:hypothetical protein
MYMNNDFIYIKKKKKKKKIVICDKINKRNNFI